MPGKDLPEPKVAPPKDDVVPVQIAHLRDLLDQTVQSRFESFCEEAASHLMAKNSNGDPLLPAGSAKATFKVSVTVERMANDSLAFNFGNEVESKMPAVPGKSRTSFYHRGKGLVIRLAKDSQMTLLDPEEGQPKPLTDEDVRMRLAPE